MIQNSRALKTVYEVNVAYNGFSYLIIYGKHINGWFLSVVNWNESLEIAHPFDIFYNHEKIGKIFGDDALGLEIARDIKEHWLDVNNEEY